jgi:hypothetical protein
VGTASAASPKKHEIRRFMTRISWFEDRPSAGERMDIFELT